MSGTDCKAAEVAKLLGVTSASIRRWHRAGLLPFEPRRDLCGRRIFSADEVSMLRDFLRRRHRRMGATVSVGEGEQA